MKAKLIVAALVLSTMWACNKTEEEAAPPPPPPPKPKEFVAPSDGLLQPEKAARWRQADSLVRLLDEAFLDSLKANPDRIAQLTAQQEAARELASRKAGLLGWKEYRWILDEAPRNPANAAAFQAAGLSMAIPVSEKKAGKGK
ncbi:MAG TPA: hypothetical protein PK208_00685 [Fibrobacteria bacterium]|nr:hypothetical protein [Fibrobacteria bacterium]